MEFLIAKRAAFRGGPVLLCLFALAGCAHFAAGVSGVKGPCTQGTAACEQWVSLGNAPGRSKVYASYPLAAHNSRITRALIMIHGASRNADHYFETAAAAAFLANALENTIVIAPRFAARDDTIAPGELLWPERGDNWRSGGMSPTNTKIASFDFMDEIIRKLSDRTVFPNLKRIVVAGHSAGGQFVTRYEMANRIHDSLPGLSLSYVVANPSSYAWPAALRPLPTGDADPATADKEALGDDGEKLHTRFEFASFDSTKAPTYNNWPSGLRNRTGYAARVSDETILKQLVARPTTYLLGQVDVLPLGGFDSSPSAMAQGPTRRARGEAFFKYVTEVLGAKHRAMIVSECGHNNRCVFTTDDVLPVIFPQ